MRFIVEMPDEVIPQKQEIVSIDLHFIDGKLCGCTYPFEELPAPNTAHCDVSEYDKDHIWYKGGQYISLRRFLEVKAEAEKEPREDCINREAAIIPFLVDATEEWTSADIVKYLKAFPSVTPAQKTGHWISCTVGSCMDNWECSVCGRRTRGKLENLPYCCCGAKMQEVKDE